MTRCRSSIMSHKGLHFASIISASVAAFAWAVPVAVAQSTSTYVANPPYSSDYEVSSWSEADRTRPSAYLEQQYLSSDELLGGPVRKPHEVRVGGDWTAAKLEGREAVAELNSRQLDPGVPEPGSPPQDAGELTPR